MPTALDAGRGFYFFIRIRPGNSPLSAMGAATQEASASPFEIAHEPEDIT